MKIGVVCGFEAEVKCFEKAVAKARLNPAHFVVRPSGSSSKRAQVISQHLITEGCGKLISFGIAGGLDPKLLVGDVVFSTYVTTMLDEVFGARSDTKSPSLRLGGSGRLVTAGVLGVDRIAFTPSDKAKLYQISRAGIADMESHSVARAAQTEGKSFMVLRAVSDGAKDTLPAYVESAVSAEGKPLLAPILKGLASNPTTLPHLLNLKKNTDRALASLEETSARILPQLVG